MPDSREQIVDFRFPLRGLDVSQAYAAQPQMSTPVGSNVRAYDPFTQRARGGQRPGLAKYVMGQLPGGAALVQELNVVVGVGYTPPGPPTGLVQQSGGASGAGASLTDTLHVAATAGNAIAVLIGTTGNFASSVTDAAGNVYNTYFAGSVASYTFELWLATNVLGGFTTITVGNTHAATVDVVSFETLPVLGQESSPNGSGGDPGTLAYVNAWTPSHSPGLYVAALRSGARLSRTAGSGWTDLKTPNSRYAVAVQHLGAGGTLARTEWTQTVYDYNAGGFFGLEMSS